MSIGLGLVITFLLLLLPGAYYELKEDFLFSFHTPKNNKMDMKK